MALIKSTIKLIIREHKTRQFSSPALTLGVPEIYATYPELNKWMHDFAGQKITINPIDITISTNETAQKLNWVTANTFFKALGIEEMFSVDIAGSEHTPNLIHDLNKPLPEKYINSFNLIVDPSTIEHVFDIKSGLTNIVHALKVGGTVIQQVPIYSYNGGYYNFNPNLLKDFYTANGFSDIKIIIIMWDRYNCYSDNNRCYEYSETYLGSRHALADYDQCRFTPHALLFAKKTKNNPEIVNPIQSPDTSNLQIQEENSHYNSDAPFLRNIKTLYRHIHRISEKFIPYSMTYHINSALSRKIQLHKIKRQCFYI
jgi:hypothetical protein